MVRDASGRHALSKIRVNDDKTVKPSSMTVPRRLYQFCTRQYRMYSRIYTCIQKIFRRVLGQVHDKTFDDWH